MKKIITIFVCGNQLLEFDSLPLKLLPQLMKKFSDINFEELDPTENLKPVDKEMIIIDTVMDISEVMIFTDIEIIQNSPNYSVHDFDLGFQLKLMKKLGQLKHVTIFGIPAEINEKTAFKQLVQNIENFLNSHFSLNT